MKALKKKLPGSRADRATSAGSRNLRVGAPTSGDGSEQALTTQEKNQTNPPSAGSSAVIVDSKTTLSPLHHASSSSNPSTPPENPPSGPFSGSLWEVAYEKLRSDGKNHKLLEHYDAIIAEEMKAPGATVNGINRLQPQERNRQVAELIQFKVTLLEETKWRGRVDATFGMIEKSVVFAKDFIGAAADASPHVALAWAGVSILLPLLSNPGNENSSRKDGLEYVTNVILRYTVVERVYAIYLKSQPTKNREDKIGSTAFRSSVMELYACILSYQIKMACILSKQTLSLLVRDIVKLDNLDSLRQEVENRDKQCEPYLKLLDQAGLKEMIAEQNENIEKLATAHLRELQQVTRGITSLNETVVGIRADEQLREQDQRQRESTYEERKCYHALSGVDCRGQKDQNPKRVSGTCLWVLQHPNYIQWRDGAMQRLLWISADAGCGKSVLSRCIIDEDLPSAYTNNGVCVIYFFFKDTVDEQRSAQSALLSLLHQLITQRPGLIKHVLPLFRQQGSMLGQASFSALWSVFMAAVKDLDAGRVFCLLDALDECRESERQSLIKTIDEFCSSARQSSSCHLRFLLTSRPYLDLKAAFAGLVHSGTGIRLDGASESDDIKKEIDLVIKHRVAELDRGINFRPDVRVYLLETLLNMQQRTYLWLRLVFEYLTRFWPGTVKQMKKIISTLPKGINAAYESLLAKCEDQEYAGKVLKIVLAAYRPLTLSEIEIALQVSGETRSYDDLDLEDSASLHETLPGRCGLMISIIDEKVYFIHQTVKEFLLREDGMHDPKQENTDRNTAPDSEKPWRGTFTIAESHHYLAMACMRVLLLHEGQAKGVHNYQGLVHVDHRWREYEMSGWSVLDTYSAIYWADHYRDSGVVETIVESLITADIMVEGTDEFRVASALQWSAAGQHEQIFDVLLRKTNDIKELTEGIYGTALIAACHGGSQRIVQILLDRAVDRNRAFGDDDSYTIPLETAAYEGHYRIVQLLLQYGAEPNTVANTEYGTALAAAASNGHEDIAKLLVAHGADLQIQDPRCGGVLYHASLGGHYGIVQWVLNSGLDVNIQGGYCGTALQTAARIGNTAIMGLLFDHGADVNIQGGHYRTALHAAAFFGYTATVGLLLDHGADVNLCDGYYGTALQAAALNGNIAMVRLLLDHGADITLYGGYCGNALQAAALSRDVNTARLLFDHGADVNLCDGYYGTALQAAAAPPNYLFPIKTRRSASINMVRLLLEHGADVNLRGGNYGTALCAAARAEPTDESTDIAKLLLDHGADVNLCGGRLGTALQAAAYMCHETVLLMLLTRGSDVNFSGSKGDTALHQAADRSPYDGGDEDDDEDERWRMEDEELRVRIAGHLLDYGADVNIRSGVYGSALHVAKRRRLMRLAGYLEEHGAVDLCPDDAISESDKDDSGESLADGEDHDDT